jgi:hypothetical protein
MHWIAENKRVLVFFIIVSLIEYALYDGHHDQWRCIQWDKILVAVGYVNIWLPGSNLLSP